MSIWLNVSFSCPKDEMDSKLMPKQHKNKKE